MPNRQSNEVPEFAHTDRAARRREIAAAGVKSHEHLDKIKKNLRMPNLVSVETQTQPLINCPEQFTVRLLTGPNQRILKRVVESWSADGQCYRTAYDFGMQFTGYSGYCMSFEKDPKETDMFGRFFDDVAAYGVNLNRAMLFLKESYANKEHPENCHRLLREGDPKNTTVTEEYLNNLNRYVDAAKDRGIVVQVCLFMHHAVAAQNECEMPKPIMLGVMPRVTPHDRYRAFLNTASEYQPTQINFIRDVVTKLKQHWNVIYEVGNELRVPQPGVDYNETHLRAWVEWVALRIRDYDKLHLIGTSAGLANEASINSIPLLQYCSFHQDQWTPNIAAACTRAGNYGGKHLIADDDGGSRELQNVRTWVRAAFDVGGGCRGSFNHKGNTMFNEYDPQWLEKYNPEAPQSWGKPREVLEAFRDARRNTSSPCARTPQT